MQEHIECSVLKACWYRNVSFQNKVCAAELSVCSWFVSSLCIAVVEVIEGYSSLNHVVNVDDKQKLRTPVVFLASGIAAAV